MLQFLHVYIPRYLCAVSCTFTSHNNKSKIKKNGENEKLNQTSISYVNIPILTLWLFKVHENLQISIILECGLGGKLKAE